MNVHPIVEPVTSDATLPIPVLLARVGRRATSALREALESIGLRPSHIAVLAALRYRTLSQAALGEQAGVDGTTLVGLLNDLEGERLVARTRDCTDRRRHIVAVTDLGLARLALVDGATAGVEDRIVRDLDASERAILHTILVRIDTCSDADAAVSGDGCEPCPRTTPPAPNAGGGSDDGTCG